MLIQSETPLSASDFSNFSSPEKAKTFLSSAQKCETKSQTAVPSAAVSFEDRCEVLGESYSVGNRDVKSSGASRRLRSRVFTGIKSVDLYCLMPFLTVADRNAIACTSSTSLAFISELEQQEKQKYESKFNRPVIKAPSNPHYFRNKYRLKGGRFFEPCGKRSGLIATEEDLGPPSRHLTLNCPILSPDGDRFLNLRGMMGQYSGLTGQLLIKIGFCVFTSPALLLACCGIMAGDCYGRSLDAQASKKFKIFTAEKGSASSINSSSTSIAKQTAVQWADDCNPCGSQSIHTSDCSCIAPPSPATNDCHSDLIFISDKGECQPFSHCNSLLRLDSILCFPVLTLYCIVASPCISMSCLGLCCGYIYGLRAQKHQQARESSLETDLPPSSQRMI